MAAERLKTTVEGKLDWRGRPAIRGKHGGLLISFIPILIYGVDNLATGAISWNLVEYLTSVMHLGIADASNQDTNFLGTLCLLTIPLGYLADAYTGRYRIAIIGGILEIIALVLLAIQAHMGKLQPPPCNPADPTSVCEKLHGRNAALFYIFLYLLALSSAGVKVGAPPHGADQFDDKDPKEAKQMSSYFNWLLFGETIAVFIGLAGFVRIQTDVSWAWGFAACAMTSFLGVTLFTIAVPRYRISTIGGEDPAVEVLKVYVTAIRNWKLPLPTDPNELYDIDQSQASSAQQDESIPHGNNFRFLDKAAIRVNTTSNPCTVSQVEKAKIIFAMVPIFISTIVLSLCLAQFQTFSVEQGYTMDRRVTSHFKMPPQPLIPCIFMMIALPAYDRLFVPFARKITGIPTGITHLQRIGSGLFFTILSMVAAALVETKRKRVAREHNMLDAIPILEPLPISVFWLSIQYLILSAGEVLTAVGMLEFFYSEAPKSLKSLAMCFYWISTSLGYFLSTVVVKVVNDATRKITASHGWLAGNNLNRNHLDLFFWLMAVLCFLNFLNYLYWARWYKYRPRQPLKRMDIEIDQVLPSAEIE